MEREEENQLTESLGSAFQKILDVHEELSTSTLSTTDPKYQEKVNDAITRLEDMTRSVSLLGVFSANESIEEVPTEHLKYLLLPALLADFTLRNLAYDRVNVLETAEIYYKDYVGRLNDYQVCDIELNPNEEEKGEKEVSVLKKDPLIKSAQLRDSKINRYREMKELEDQLSQLKRLIIEQQTKGLSVDEEVERKFYLKLIHRWLNRAIDELATVEMEKPMAAMRVAMITQGQGDSSKSMASRPKVKPRPPIIITRNELQKKVYGIGYPGVPTVTIDEFVNQKIQEGSLALTDQNVYSNSLYDWANNPEKKKQEELCEEEGKERLIEREDPQELARMRAMDDWKDDHRRGEGNRHNMG